MQSHLHAKSSAELTSRSSSSVTPTPSQEAVKADIGDGRSPSNEKLTPDKISDSSVAETIHKQVQPRSNSNPQPKSAEAIFSHPNRPKSAPARM